jgi:hypothetical protein
MLLSEQSEKSTVASLIYEADMFCRAVSARRLIWNPSAKLQICNFILVLAQI